MIIENTYLLLGILMFLLLIGSGFFSMTETALTNCSKAKIHRLAKDGNKRAIRTEFLIKNSDNTISAILLCNNAINILASAIATSVLIKAFGETGVIYATLIMTMLILIFGEIAPKTYALRHSEKMILSASATIYVLVKIFNPITKSIQIVINKAFKIFGSKTATKGRKHKLISDLEEIRGTIDLKHKAGSIVKYEKDMLDSILNMEDTEIANVMIHRQNIDSININQDLKKILKQALEINHSKIPLWDKTEDNIVSVLHVRRLITVLHSHNGDFTKIGIKQVTIDPWFVPESNTLKNQLISFRNKKAKFALVINEYGSLMGIVTMEDILEEIVGDMDDKEGGKSKMNIIKFKDGNYKISGELPIRDINRKLNWSLPEDDETSTLAGLLIARIERIPEEKEKFEFDGFRVTVLKKTHNKLLFLKVTQIKQPD
ncbi:MAG: Mg2+/Co2+ transporter CorB [Lentimonas sp.]|jgi:Mg2+/Co2+ transporter CorB